MAKIKGQEIQLMSGLEPASVVGLQVERRRTGINCQIVRKAKGYQGFIVRIVEIYHWAEILDCLQFLIASEGQGEGFLLL